MQVIKLVYCIRRRSEISYAEFEKYWWEEHGPKVRSVAEKLGALKYVQSHLCMPEMNQALVDSRGLAKAYDGLTEVWFESEETMSQALSTPEGQEALHFLVNDEATFIDFSQSTVFMSVEREVFDLT